MRNVTIWKRKGFGNSDIWVTRVYTYRGVKRTLNQFLSPKYILRDGHICLRDRKADSIGALRREFTDKKGVTCIVKQNTASGDMIFVAVVDSFEAAVAYVMNAGLEFWGDESDNKVGHIKLKCDRVARQKEFENLLKRRAGDDLSKKTHPLDWEPRNGQEPVEKPVSGEGPAPKPARKDFLARMLGFLKIFAK